jgi:2-polyprenyl-6-hydroxyphenyl methylase / 3-demethylubiquinone-9 3-methyltransferase
MNNQSTIDDAEISKFAQHASHWWEKEGPLKTLHAINPARLEFITQNCDLLGRSVLDVGCGGGILSEALAQKGAQVIGIDVEANALDAAKKHAKLNQLFIDYQICPIENFTHQPFDIITCMEMLEHVQEPQLVLDHCARLLKPGGYLFLSTINRTVKAYGLAILAAEYILGLLPKQTHDFSKFIKPSELTAMARLTGFELHGIAGIAYNPLHNTAILQENVDVNYLISYIKL